MKNLLSLTALTLSIALFAAGCTPAPTPMAPVNELPLPSPVSTLPVPPAPTYPEEPPVVRLRPLQTICDTKNFICVGSQLINAHLTNPLHATGTAIAFENTFQWKLENASNTQVAQGTLMANAPDIGQAGPFTLHHTSQIFTPGSYTLTFFEASAKDGSPIHLLSIPVQF